MEQDEDQVQQDLEYELESELDENETFHSEMSDYWDEQGLYSNPWKQEEHKDFCEIETPNDYNPTLYLTETITEDKPPFQVGVLDKIQKQKVDELFTGYPDVFAENISEEGQTIELGQTHIVEHTINTKDATSVKQKVYRIASSNQDFVKREIQTMLEKGLIRESASPWASPIATEKDVYPLPVIDDILKSFKGVKWFLSLDLVSGHEISWQGIRPDKEKLIKVKEFLQPTNLRTLRGFLDVLFEWKSEQQEAFEWLKIQLITVLILRYPDFSQPFYLHTDASGTGLGAILAQKDENKNEYVVAYASRSLNRAERNYSTTEQECLAVIWAVEHFKHYFGISPFFVVTDHSALKWLRTTELKG
ncbi:6769_t:CDS:2, partial [Dentiscutata erythropus]